MSLVRLENSADHQPGLVCIFDHNRRLEEMPSATAHDHLNWSDSSGGSGFLMLLDRNDLALPSISRGILGAGSSERIGIETIIRHVHEEDRELARSVLEGSTLARLPVRVRFHRLDGGHERNLEIGPFKPIVPHCPRLGIWGALRDVTVEVQRDEELRRCRSQLRAVLENVPDGIALIESNGRICEINQAAQAILDLEVGDRLLERHPGLNRDPLFLGIEKVLAGGGRIEEERFVPGLSMWLTYSVSPVGACALLVVQRRDDVYRLKAAVDDMSSRCNTAFDLGHVGLWEFDVMSRRLWLAQSAREFLGVTSLTVDDFMARVHEEDVARVNLARETAVSRRGPIEVDFRYTTADGRVRRLRWRGGFVPGLHDGVLRMAGVVLDLDDFGAGSAGDDRPTVSDDGVVGAQIRAARGALRWSVRELASRSDVSVATINRFEAERPAFDTRASSVEALVSTLKARGIGFHRGPTGKPAIEIDPTGRGSERR
ncbi:PAS domain-containing protein [Enterovirga aerilata]|uniref:PAS domain-containing protein n=1 Tax=Enterovirga aerilata TaxID=2730920 RepID=UPI001AEF2475